MSARLRKLRAEVFRDLTEDADRTESIADILKRPDETDEEQEAANEAYHKRQGEPYLRTDSRFSDCWYRILAHLAADEVYVRPLGGRGNRTWRITSFGEEWLETWESIIGEEMLWPALFPGVAIGEGRGVCLF